ncbi:MAG TPA: flavodoxin-dependent (E)-4-hydroxy-3-methylbut-2-enyl-diphosphate synthase [Clostridiales bacterium]|nr:flavodoxin-dependent (E)-4-hydroxy-3-methylbut-2-enyl-diphosphate synthase [Clostridiales bacterium]
MRRHTKVVSVGSVMIGSPHPISIQSMTTAQTKDIKNTIEQIQRLEKVGCDLVRLAIRDEEDARAVERIKKSVSIPLIGDIHYDYRLALKVMDYGIDKIRINPGNIGSFDRTEKIIKKAADRQIPIRIGVNSGSINKEILRKYRGVNARAMVASALEYIDFFERHGFKDIVVSMKASSVPLTIESYRLICEKVDYPMHIGITEAGTFFKGSIWSAVGIGALLSMGIGDTLRVSLTDDPLNEVKVAKEILKSLELRDGGVTIVSCPTCGRCTVNLIEIANEVEKRVKDIKAPLKVAIMGCSVNGPGEAKEADIGIASGNKMGVLFKKGTIIKKVPEDKIIDELVKEIQSMAGNGG